MKMHTHDDTVGEPASCSELKCPNAQMLTGQVREFDAGKLEYQMSCGHWTTR